MYRCGKEQFLPHRWERLWWLAATLELSAFILVPSVFGSDSQVKVTPSLFGVSEWSYTSAQICRRCHPDHYDMWSHSMHGLSVEDPMFRVSYLQAQVIEGDAARERCLTCHAPLATPLRDHSLSMELTREGVTCDFCHTVTAVHLDRKTFAYENSPGVTKYGPILAQPTAAHRSSQSELFKSSHFCGGCHELVNDHGVTVMGTYSEWLDGPYPKEGVHCQNCHMPLTMKATAITADGDTTKNLAHDHQFQGGHSQINLRHAASLELVTEILGRTAQVHVYITNKESGHKLPTGMPGRKLILNVRVYDERGELLAQPTRIFRKALVDEDGTILEGNTNQLLKAVKVYYDNRIAPKERRALEYLVDLPEDVTQVSVYAELLYVFEAPVMYTQEIKTEMATQRTSFAVTPVATSIPDQTGEMWRLLWVCLLLGAVFSVSLYLLDKRRKRIVSPKSADRGN